MSYYKFAVGDRVYNYRTEEKGSIHAIYPEIDLAIIETAIGLSKAHMGDLLLARSQQTIEPEIKKRTLLDKIKARITGSYD